MTDRFALRGASGKIKMSLMTPCTVRPDGARAVILSGGMLGKANVRIAVKRPLHRSFARRKSSSTIPAARVMGQSPVSNRGRLAEPSVRGRTEIRDHRDLMMEIGSSQAGVARAVRKYDGGDAPAGQGNMSSASVMFVLSWVLARGGDVLLGCALAFGPGLTAPRGDDVPGGRVT